MSIPGLHSILYVEDDVHIRTTAKLVLEVIGKCQVRACSSGKDALRTALDFKPDLVLLDMVMPELDGLALLRRLRAMPHLGCVPAVFVTSHCSREDVDLYLSAGAIGVVKKPLLPMRLTEQVRDLWERRAPQTLQFVA